MFPFRLLFAVLRSGLMFVSLVASAWFMLVSPTPQELDRLAGGSRGESELRQAVQQMRLARAALALAPDLAVAMITRQGQGSVSRAEVEAILRAMAEGRRPDQDIAPRAATGGAKFLRVAPSRG